MLGISLGRFTSWFSTLQAQALSILRRPDIDAHVYLPGSGGVSISGLLTNNYTDSTGSTGYSANDGVAGLVLDGMGSVGEELATDPQPSTPWVNNGDGSYSKSAGVDGSFPFNGNVLSSGDIARLSFEVVSISGGSITPYIGGSIQAAISTIGQKEIIAAAGASVITDCSFYASAATACTLRAVSCKQISGIHATQTTTANKPAVRRGVYNELLNSATPATQNVTCIAAPYTLALYGTGSVTLSGTGSGTLNGTGASDLVVLNFTPTAGTVTFTKSGTVSSFGLFKGTLTAAQILAEGGIPLTTSAAASNPNAGRYWWSFDGADSLTLGSVPFQMGDDHAVITAVAAGGAGAAYPYAFALGSGGAGGQLIAALLNAGGTLQYRYKNDALTTFALPVDASYTGGATVASLVKVGSTATSRKNGAVVSSAAPTGATTVSVAVFGNSYGAGGGSWNGFIGPVIVIKGTVSDADLLTLERWVASLTPNGPVF